MAEHEGPSLTGRELWLMRQAWMNSPGRCLGHGAPTFDDWLRSTVDGDPLLGRPEIAVHERLAYTAPEPPAARPILRGPAAKEHTPVREAGCEAAAGAPRLTERDRYIITLTASSLMCPDIASWMDELCSWSAWRSGKESEAKTGTREEMFAHLVDIKFGPPQPEILDPGSVIAAHPGFMQAVERERARLREADRKATADQLAEIRGVIVKLVADIHILRGQISPSTTSKQLGGQG